MSKRDPPIGLGGRHCHQGWAYLNDGLCLDSVFHLGYGLFAISIKEIYLSKSAYMGSVHTPRN